jgi:hypothetical protein
MAYGTWGVNRSADDISSFVRLIQFHYSSTGGASVVWKNTLPIWLSKRQCLLLVLTAGIFLGIPNCASRNNPLSAQASAMTLVSPVAGQRFSLSDSIFVKWISNPDSIGTLPLNSFTRVFSLDSGKSWITMNYNPASAIQDSNVYQFEWTGVDTTQINPVTLLPLTKADFLHKGVVVEIVSYPPESVKRQSGYIFFYE